MIVPHIVYSAVIRLLHIAVVSSDETHKAENQTDKQREREVFNKRIQMATRKPAIITFQEGSRPIDHPSQTIDLDLDHGRYGGQLDCEERTEAVEAKPNNECKWLKLQRYKRSILQKLSTAISRNGKKNPYVR